MLVSFPHMITFRASILVTRCQGRLFFWRSAENRFNCDLFVVDGCSFNDQMTYRARTVQSVIFLMEITRNAATHEWRTLRWSFLKALNNWCRSRAVVEKRITATIFFPLFASLLLTFAHPDPVGRRATDSLLFFFFFKNQAQHLLMSIELLCVLTGTSRNCGADHTSIWVYSYSVGIIQPPQHCHNAEISLTCHHPKNWKKKPQQL